MAANNNTTSLSMGAPISTRNFSDYTAREISMGAPISTRNFSDYTAREMSTAVARHNYNKVSDAKLDEFKRIVIRMVSSWAVEDKVRILSEYGDLPKLNGNTNEKAINTLLAETLIVHLNQSDLERLVSDTLVTEKKGKAAIKKAQSKQKANNKKILSAFNVSTFNTVADTLKNAKNQRQLKKQFNKVVSEYKVPKALQNQYRKLRNELKDVLKNCFNKVEIANIAASMDIVITDGLKQEETLFKQIINKTVLYVDLLVGKSKYSNLANSIGNFEAYNNLLQYTSYAYVTGRASLGTRDWATLKRNARLAKKAMQERLNMQSSRAKQRSQDFKDVAGVTSRTSAGKIQKNDQGILKDKTLDELLELCGIYGVDPTKKNEGKIKLELYRAIAAENKRVRDLNVQANKQRKGNVIERRDTNDLLKIHSMTTANLGKRVSSSAITVPIIHFTTAGEIIEKSILEAVPVYLVGQGGSGTVDPSKVAKQLSGDHSKAIKLSVNITDVNEIPDIQWNAYERIRNMPRQNPNVRKRNEFTDMDSLRDFLLGYVKKSVLESIDNNTVNDDERRKIFYAYLYSKIKKYKYLESYITNRYGIVITSWKSKRKTTGRFMKKVGIGYGALAGVKAVGALAISGGGGLLLGIGVLAGVLAGIKALKKAKNFKNAQNFEDLPESSQAFFSSYKNKSIEELKALCGKAGYDVASIDSLITPINEKDTKKKILIYFIAKSNGQKELAKWLERDLNRLGITKATLNSIPKRKKVKSFIKNILNSLKTPFKKKGTGQYSADMSERDKSDFNPAENEGQRLPIPKVFYVPGERPEITEVVPVYVVNTEDISNVNVSKDAISGGTGIISISSNNNNSGNIRQAGGNNTESTTNNNSSVSNVSNTSNTTNVIKGGRKGPRIKKGRYPEEGLFQARLTKPASKTLEKMEKTGYEPLSKQLTEDKQKGDFVNFKIEDRKWANKNKWKFATGGVGTVSGKDIIVGDSLNGRENPEKVHIEPDGSFFVSPLKRSAANGYSPLAEKFAKGTKGGSAKDKTFASYVYEKTTADNISASASSAGITEILKGAALPVYVINSKEEDETATWLESNMHSYMMALGMPQVMAAPMGVGTIANPALAAMAGVNTGMSVANSIGKAASSALKMSTGIGFAANTGGTITKANTGGTITRFNSGGYATSAITGDAAGANIFANGAKPELVQSTGDMKVTPLNSGGTASKQKINRMSSSERQNALATSIASHVVKFSTAIPSGVSELSNQGEAIKVYSVKPGINDEIDVGGVTTSLMGVLLNIYNQVSAIANSGASSNALLGTIAANTAATVSAVSGGGSSSGGGNPFAGGFPDSLDDILSGQ